MSINRKKIVRQRVERGGREKAGGREIAEDEIWGSEKKTRASGEKEEEGKKNYTPKPAYIAVLFLIAFRRRVKTSYPCLNFFIVIPLF